jgi:hypothetical protein
MVDTRLPEHWSRRLQMLELSDPAWRLLTNALMWSNSQGTDGVIPSKALHLCHSHWQQHVIELIEQGLWEEISDGYRCVGDWEVEWGQSSAAYVADLRETARLRQQRKRSREKQEDVTRDVPRDVPRDVGKAGSERNARPSDYEFSKPCSKCGTKTSAWVTDLAAVLCARCETEENPW